MDWATALLPCRRGAAVFGRDGVGEDDRGRGEAAVAEGEEQEVGRSRKWGAFLESSLGEAVGRLWPPFQRPVEEPRGGGKGENIEYEKGKDDRDEALREAHQHMGIV